MNFQPFGYTALNKKRTESIPWWTFFFGGSYDLGHQFSTHESRQL